VETNFERRGETKEKMIDRLYNEKKINQSKLDIIANNDKQSFAPKINEYSKNLPRTINDLTAPKVKLESAINESMQVE